MDEKHLKGIRERNEKRKASEEIGGVREWFEIDYLLRYIDNLEAKLKEQDEDVIG